VRVTHMMFKDEDCAMQKIAYNPVSSKYEGWIRFAPNDECDAVGKAMFGVSYIGKDPIAIHWLSISKEVQNGQSGFAQLGYQNDADPGAGATAKLFLRCWKSR
jgi:hypothetical protein